MSFGTSQQSVLGRESPHDRGKLLPSPCFAYHLFQPSATQRALFPFISEGALFLGGYTLREATGGAGCVPLVAFSRDSKVLPLQSSLLCLRGFHSRPQRHSWFAWRPSVSDTAKRTSISPAPAGVRQRPDVAIVVLHLGGPRRTVMRGHPSCARCWRPGDGHVIARVPSAVRVGMARMVEPSFRLAEVTSFQNV